jgi:hypothetical protein
MRNVYKISDVKPRRNRTAGRPEHVRVWEISLKIDKYGVKL